MKYAAEIGSGAMIYIPSFINIGSGIQKLIGGDTQKHRQHGDLISLLLFFQNEEGSLSMRWYGLDSSGSGEGPVDGSF
jgi:hypothetical protein